MSIYLFTVSVRYLCFYTYEKSDALYIVPVKIIYQTSRQPIPWLRNRTTLHKAECIPEQFWCKMKYRTTVPYGTRKYFVPNSVVYLYSVAYRYCLYIYIVYRQAYRQLAGIQTGLRQLAGKQRFGVFLPKNNVWVTRLYWYALSDCSLPGILSDCSLVSLLSSASLL